MDDGNIQSKCERSFLLFFRRASARKVSSEKWRAQCRLIFRIYANVTEWQRLERGGELQVGRAFSGDTAACFWHYPLDKGVVVEKRRRETGALTPPGGNSVNSVRGTFAVVHLGEPRRSYASRSAGVGKTVRGRRGCGGDRSGRVWGQPTEEEEDRWSWAR